MCLQNQFQESDPPQICQCLLLSYLFPLLKYTIFERGAANDFYDEPIVLIKGWKVEDNERLSRVGKNNLIRLNKALLEIKIRQV